MSTTYYGFNNYVFSETGMNQLLDTDWTKLDTILYTMSGTITLQEDHGNLDGLADDDHTQYVLADGTRGFSSTVSGTTPVAGDDLATKDYVDGIDHSSYIKANGDTPFSATISGVTPTVDAHLATKGYVDGLFSSGWTGSIPTISGTVTIVDGLITNYA